MKKKIIFNIIAIALLLAFAVSFSFIFPSLYLRFWQALKEFGIAVAFWCEQSLNNLFSIKLGWNIVSTINESNYIEGFSLGFLPDDWNDFVFQLKVFFENFIVLDFWKDYFQDFGNVMTFIARAAFLLFPCIFIVYFLFRSYFFYHEKEEVGVVSRQLVGWNKFVEKRDEIKALIREFFVFFRSKWYYYFTFLLCLAFFTNAISILIAFLGYYLYFSSSFNFLSLWSQTVRLYFDISFMFRWVYLPFWLALTYFVFKRIFLGIADSRKSNDLGAGYNFIKNILGLMTLFVGTMGRYKTTLEVYCSLLFESYFKQVALDKMTIQASFFPKEDWRKFEVKFDESFNKHEFYNLPTLNKWLDKTLDESLKEQSFFDGACLKTLYDTYKVYAQLYFVYMSPTSLIQSTIGGRSGLFEIDSIHFPEFVDDFMGSSQEHYVNSNFFHIGDDNNYRPLKKINFNLDYSKAIDIGVYIKDEVGKDRKNQLESADIKKDADEANQKNDGFNLDLKLRRQAATIDGFCFWRFLSSEQRMESVPADFRELNDTIVSMGKTTKTKNVFPFYPFIEWVLQFPLSVALTFFNKFRFNRDDNTLLFQWIKNSISRINKFKDKMDKLYGIKVLSLTLLDDKGTPSESMTLPLLHSLIRSKRFVTDALGSMYEARGLESPYGLNDIPTFACERATVPELMLTNQYFVNEILYAANFENTNYVPPTKKTFNKWKKW